MATYHVAMAEEAVGTQLVDEAVDVTTSELHARVVWRLRAALSHALRGRAGVLTGIFLRVDEREQVSPDVLVAPGVTPGTRSVYAVPPEPVPSVTIEVLSPANATPRGRAELEAKRSLFARIGVPLHVEIDPDNGFVAVWELVDGATSPAPTCAPPMPPTPSAASDWRRLPPGCCTFSSRTATRCSTATRRSPGPNGSPASSGSWALILGRRTWQGDPVQDRGPPR